MRTTLGAVIQRHPAVSYFVLTFAISWGGILAIVGPTHVLAEPAVFDGLTWVAPLVLGPSIAGIAITAVVGGRRGLREYRDRLCRWRVGARWIALALLAGPIYMTVTALAMSTVSPAYLPAFITTGDRGSLLVTGTIVGLSAGVFEELGWTGFATPALRRRHTSLATGLIVGSLWGLWHVLPEILGARSLDYVAYLPLQLTSVVVGLVAFRILMVWVYDRTQSLLVGILMHTGLTASLMMIQPLISGASLVGFGIAQATVAWLIVAAVAVVRRRARSAIAVSGIQVPKPLYNE